MFVVFKTKHILGSVAVGEGIEPLVFALYREIFSSLLMWGMAYYQDGYVPIKREHYGYLAAMGFFSFVNVVGTLLALKYIPASNYAIAQPMIVIVSTILSVLLKIETVSRWKVLGIAISVLGAGLVEIFSLLNIKNVDDDKGSDEDGMVLGNLILLAQVVGMGSLVVIQKQVSEKYPSSSLTAYYYSIGSLLTVVACLAGNYPSHKYALQDWEAIVWVALMYVSIVGTVFAYLALSWVLTAIFPSSAIVFNTLQPVGTLVMSSIFLGDTIYWYHILGTCLVGVGLYITNILAIKKEKSKQDQMAEREQHSVLTGDTQSIHHEQYMYTTNEMQEQETNDGIEEGESKDMNTPLLQEEH